MRDKIIQDPLHGYIPIQHMFMNIVDSMEFQRLKWIEQGSFRVLYPGARHDRFIHSLGTFYLAQKTSESFFKNIREDLPQQTITEKEKEILENTFLYAALLHDIGHAPFSHTCEEYFLMKRGIKEESYIEEQLIETVENLKIEVEDKEKFKKEYESIKPSEHEIMSAIILAKKAQVFLGEEYIDLVDIELAMRMVMGLAYEKKEGVEGIRNCLIQLLNSGTVDVDKLDYICRDSKMMGFSNSAIDIERITGGVTAIQMKYGDIRPAFRKNTLSVIDNVFRAKEEEGKWVISHPVVVYEAELLKSCIEAFGKDYLTTIFSYEALGKEGLEFNGKKYKLLSDIDIIHDLKQNSDETLVEEYFDRSKRRRPVWKSYYEYINLIKQVDDERNIENFQDFFSPLIDYLETTRNFVLNEEVYNTIMTKETKHAIKRSAELLKEICEEANVELDLVLIKVKNSFAKKISAENVYIKFPNFESDKPCTYNDLRDKQETNVRSNEFFYLYSKKRIDINIFEKRLYKIMRIMNR